MGSPETAPIPLQSVLAHQKFSWGWAGWGAPGGCVSRLKRNFGHPQL